MELENSFRNKDFTDVEVGPFNIRNYFPFLQKFSHFFLHSLVYICSKGNSQKKSMKQSTVDGILDTM